MSLFLVLTGAMTQLEPMAHATAKVVNKGERAKFRAELKEPATGTKRKREGDEDDSDADGEDGKGKKAGPEKKINKRKGPKGPNPLSVKKAKKKAAQSPASKQEDKLAEEGGSSEQPAKKKRKRKQKKTDAPAEGGDDHQHVGSDDE